MVNIYLQQLKKNGNRYTNSITINNIDKNKPNVSINKNETNWTNKGV